jgi:hypothetical protein
MSQLRNIVKEASMEPGSLPIGRLAPRSWSNLLGGSRGHTWLYSNQQLRGAAGCFLNGGLMADLTREVEDLRARTLVGSHAGRPKASQMMNLHQTKSREARRHCSAAPFRRVPRLRGPRRTPLGRGLCTTARPGHASARTSSCLTPSGIPRTSAAANQRVHRRAAGLERGHVHCFTAHRCTKQGRVSCKRVGGGRHVELTASQK